MFCAFSRNHYLFSYPNWQPGWWLSQIRKSTEIKQQKQQFRAVSVMADALPSKGVSFTSNPSTSIALGSTATQCMESTAPKTVYSISCGAFWLSSLIPLALFYLMYLSRFYWTNATLDK